MEALTTEEGRALETPVAKVQLLLAVRDGVDRGPVGMRLIEEARRLAAGAPVPCSYRVGVRIENDPTAAAMRGAESDSSSPSFAAFLDLTTLSADADAPLVTALTGLGDRLADVAVPERGAVLSGVEYLLKPGADSLILIFPLRRLQSLSSAQFHDYWLRHHSDVALRTPGLAGYKQFHAEPAATRAAARAAGLGVDDWDGTAEACFRSLDHFTEFSAQPEAAKEALEDEQRFIDHSRSGIGLFDIVGCG